jgi:hypothetical protein
MASFLLDGLLVGLLIATIIYASILDRRLRTFRQARDEMQALLANFTAATIQAQSSMATLRDASQTTSADLRNQFEKGKALRDDLGFLLERGTSLADRLESGVSAARASSKATDNRGSPAARLVEAMASQTVPSGAGEDRSKTPVGDFRAEPRLAPNRAEPRAPAPSDAAFQFLRALKSAR